MEQPAPRPLPFLALVRKALPIGYLIIGWFGRATVDNKIALVELIELAEAVIQELELDIAIEVPAGLSGVVREPQTATLVGTVTGTVTPAGEGR